MMKLYMVKVQTTGSWYLGGLKVNTGRKSLTFLLGREIGGEDASKRSKRVGI